MLQYLVKPCVRGFSEMPNDHEFDSGELSLVVDDYNPGCDCFLFPCCYKRLTLTAKVTPFLTPQSPCNQTFTSPLLVSQRTLQSLCENIISLTCYLSHHPGSFALLICSVHHPMHSYVIYLIHPYQAYHAHQTAIPTVNCCFA